MDPLANLLYATETAVFDAMSPADLAKLKSLSQSIRQLELCYEGTIFSLHRLYGAFFDSSPEIDSFRSVLRDTEALVSGSAVVQFLSRTAFGPSDLDVFANLKHVVRLGRFLMDVGYSYVPMATVKVGGVKVSEEQHPDFEVAVRLESLKCTPNTGTVADRYEFTTIGGVFNFVNERRAKVQLVAARTEPIEVIMGFYSTLVMNVATATEVISFYPRTSFVFHRALYLKQGTRTVDAGRQKYEARGWESYDEVSAEQFLRSWSEVSGNTRWVGDPHCWVVKLPPLRGRASNLLLTLRVASWQLTSAFQATLVLKNRMDNPLLDRSYVTTWNAMLSVWHHPCFACMGERSVLTRRGLPFDGVGASTVSPEKLVSAVEVMSKFTPLGASGGRLSEDSEVTLDPSYLVLGYVATRRGCSHSLLVPPLKLDSVVVEFLQGLYPLLAEEHRTSWPMMKLREAFSGLQVFRASKDPSLWYPTGHVVTMILQCLEDIDVTGLCDDVDISVRFDVDAERKLITTACDVILSPDRLKVVRKEIPAWTWSEDYMEQAGLMVRLTAF